ncbi:MAG: acyltransferase [Actinobacteria bacterium]|nr:acyltransferase [Thermoleophilia bacterium]MCB9012383.1 acyltransferase [Actinomycetota bacterium]
MIAYHASIPGFSGGYVALDLFFVLSGFLITGLLLVEAENTGRFSILQFFARRIRRLLPALFLVLGVVVAAAWVFMNPLHRPGLIKDVVFANFYVVNWRFAEQQIDYQARSDQVSALQHTWSLSVEEQFYFVWPFLLLIAVWWWHRRHQHRSLRAAAFVPVAAIGVASLAYSILRSDDLGYASYFATFPRIWEFALGAMVAMIPPHWLRMPRWLGTALVVGAIIAFVTSAAVYNETTNYPGAAALVPTLATAVIVAVGVGRSLPILHAIGNRVTRYVGRISYSWYLWHWPFIIFAVYLWGPLNMWQKLLAGLLSVIPAIIAFSTVEEPLRRSRWLATRPVRNYRMALAGTVVVATFAGIAWSSTPSLKVADLADVQGAAVLEAHPLQRTVRAIRPNPRSAVRDRGEADKAGCLAEQTDTRSKTSCVFGVKDSPTTVVLFGDSHAAHWFPALNVVAKQRNWRVVVLAKSGCTTASVTPYNTQFKRPYRECPTWRNWALSRIAKLEPSMVITSGPAFFDVMQNGSIVTDDAARLRLLQAGYATTYRKLKRTGARIVVIGDTPRPKNDPRACVAKNPDQLAQCAFTTREGYDFRPVDLLAARRVKGVSRVASRSAFCRRNGVCPAVVGNALVYRNAGHITATYMRTLSPWLGRRLPKTLEPRS